MQIAGHLNLQPRIRIRRNWKGCRSSDSSYLSKSSSMRPGKINKKNIKTIKNWQLLNFQNGLLLKFSKTIVENRAFFVCLLVFLNIFQLHVYKLAKNKIHHLHLSKTFSDLVYVFLWQTTIWNHIPEFGDSSFGPHIIASYCLKLFHFVSQQRKILVLWKSNTIFFSENSLLSKICY